MGGLPPESKWVPSAGISKKHLRLIKVSLVLPVICINEHIVQMACFEKCENLRMNEQFEEN